MLNMGAVLVHAAAIVLKDVFQCLARLQEDKLRDLRQPIWHPFSSRSWAPPKANDSSLPLLLLTPPTPKWIEALPSPRPSSLPLKQLTTAQIQELLERSLCFNCDKHFHRRHRCKAKFYLLTMADDSKDEIVPED
ncbi:hypothetical protein Pint_25321 [Pistacia integerrima]|uniref:Uncharacterized protein n=1 Tax=Pistacia integerrima TaxID=434235 RepID=A0ACC0YGA7_9ROSI|nr:hypothetical protein Pint_25321 [Pistacia integerrima]